MAHFGIDLKPLERGMDALVRMADGIERLAEVAEEGLRLARERQEI